MIWITNDAFHWDDKEESPLHLSHTLIKVGRIYGNALCHKQKD